MPSSSLSTPAAFWMVATCSTSPNYGVSHPRSDQPATIMVVASAGGGPQAQ
jgi:hypothetical protein